MQPTEYLLPALVSFGVCLLIVVTGRWRYRYSADLMTEVQKVHDNFVTRIHGELDLTDQASVRAFFEKEKLTQVYLAAAKVGGIHANNTYPAEFIY